ncbi:LytR/AlgR family response regulator transcription factor [Chitinimonas koreensis]|uniref:LytR/AlgR family response regulator transcription factor n=1 Tax=Chitinimonas koreensis TaxID=356302 RepID=UPI0003F4D049|nr:LytTR family DNA-binding domain-containing protein [Chitinimonas koreensis]QNM98224.1 response regulator transcription factor [Chitinimonas koreensis]
MDRNPAPTAVIADDERLMREQIIGRLREAWPELVIVGEAANGREAVALVRSQEPDIVFLDIRMPEMTGVEAAKALAGQCHVVFVTAYDQYAVEAFDQGAVDYLLKPADPERLKVAVERLKARLGKQPDDMEALLDKLSQRLGGGSGAVEARPREYLRWIQASVGNNIRMIPTSEVLFFRAEDKYTRVQTEGYEALIRKPIKELVDELDPEEFWQIHRAILVRVTAITEVSRDFRGQQIVALRGSPEKLEVSRSYNHLFKHM